MVGLQFNLLMNKNKTIAGLKKSEQFYRDIIETNPDAIIGVDDAGRIFMTNKEANTLFGFAREELLNQSIELLVPARNRTAHASHRQKYFLHGRNRPMGHSENVFYGLRKSGEEFPVDISLNTFVHEQEKKIISTIRDNSSVLKVQQQLRKNELFVRGILDALPAHISVIDTKGTIIETNLAWKNFAKYNGDAHTLAKTGIGANYFDVCNRAILDGDELATKALEGIKLVLNGDRNSFFLEYPCHSNEKRMWFLMRVLRLQGEIPFLVILHQDISERKQAEVKLIENIAELKKVNAELDHFVYSTSHDLRAPLASIMGLSSIIEEESGESDTRQHIRMIKSSIQGLDDFIRKILLYSKNSRMGIFFEWFNIYELIQKVIHSLTYMETTGKITYSIVCAPDQMIYSDKERIWNILENLIGNSIKYADRTKDEHWISIEVTINNKDVHLLVSDNGIGIAEEHLGKIFNMFYRATTLGNGNGLGLYLIKESISKLNGEITVMSKSDIGTTFSVTLFNANPNSTSHAGN